MNLEELKKEAYKDLPITDQEHLDQESFRNQEIKSKWLDYKTRFELLLVKNKGDYQNFIEPNGNTMVVSQMQKYMHLNHLTSKYLKLILQCT